MKNSMIIQLISLITISGLSIQTIKTLKGLGELEKSNYIDEEEYVNE